MLQPKAEGHVQTPPTVYSIASDDLFTCVRVLLRWYAALQLGRSISLFFSTLYFGDPGTRHQ